MVSNLIQLPIRTANEKKKERRHVNLDKLRYYSEAEIKALRRLAREQAEVSASRGTVTGIRTWMVVDLLTSSGLRVSEAANLCCGDLRIGHGQAEIHVRNGKGNVSGMVVIPDSLKRHLKTFLLWKEQHREDISSDAPLFQGQRGKVTSQALQLIIKKCLKRLGLYEKGKSAHSLRHSYAVALYKQNKDLRAVQKQLRHVSIQSTTIYADVTKEELQEQVKGLWG
ncbi:MAG: integrase [Deltaproteobacteria bacterium HGW-Deltaproteobacteria-15]|jgi:site-specific recombinase XerD|nr:MAG: integrase [Deltaproteobacteria bacterium HGW-Deltaproteobacteria-15]